MNDQVPAPSPVARLIRELNRFPGIGIKSAQRLAYYIIRLPAEEVEGIAESILGVKDKIIYCSICQNLTEVDPCELCSDPHRNNGIICVVEEPLDVLAIERAGFYKGYYHVLHGVVSPMNGIGPNDLRIKELLPRLNNDVVREVILGVNPTLEGDATSMYIQRLISPLGIKVTNLARGLPIGGQLEYADAVTLNRAYQGRIEL